MQRWRTFLLYFILIISVFSIVEFLSYLFGVHLQKRGVFYVPQVTQTYREYLAWKDPRIGWPSRAQFGLHDLDQSGARISPAYPDSRAPACVSIYGDSFAYGDEVDNEHAWGNLLAQKLHCRVANFGYPAYGTDQAYLRFHFNKEDTGRIVILCHLTENITRNVAQFRNLAVPCPKLLLKPRFILAADGQLQLIPIPSLNERDFLELQEHPEKYLTHEFFLPGGASGITRLTFPYLLSMARLPKRLYIKAWLAGKPRFADFYQPNHPAQGLQITTGILEKFYHEAQARGKLPLIIIFPTLEDMQYYKKKREWIYEPLLKRLAAKKIDFINVGVNLIDYLGKRNCSDLYNNYDFHFNNEGNATVADIVYKEIMARKMLAQ